MERLTMKRLLCLLLICILCVSIIAAGCSSKPGEPVVSSEGEGETKKDTIVIKLGHHHNVDGIVDLYCKKFVELSSAKSNGRIKVDVYPGAQLGQEFEAAEGILMALSR